MSMFHAKLENGKVYAVKAHGRSDVLDLLENAGIANREQVTKIRRIGKCSGFTQEVVVAE